ncbi:CHY zinc finger protein [Dietzia sp. PP-33]|uniref:CHY zinc finger protein n=1 Tax=Dietzia sp. PP-33 TaxID=2957500 RepID=UPI0029AEC0F1|nr:CHY zinc finger protein [Dietzia sp. PP-33]MDX2357738.1 CHY zinc finger protein [Dietzia sp. PP-33]
MTSHHEGSGDEGSGGGDGAGASIPVLGATVDDQTRCVHYRGPLDVVAIRFHCCLDFYPCFRCHADATDHALSVWPRDEFDSHALLCGACRTTLSITEYQSTDACPACGTAFNPGCSLHYPLYFES